MKQLVFFLLLISFQVKSQQKITRAIETKASFVEVHTQGIDDILVEESESNNIEMIVNDADGLGVIENFTCTDLNCVLEIKTELKIDHPITNKANQLPISPPSNVRAVLKVPKNKRIAIFGGIIDVTSNGYSGVLQIQIEKGKVAINKNKGVTEINLSTGSVFASIDDEFVDVRTRKGKITYNKKTQKSPFKIKVKSKKELLVKSINANIILATQSQ